MKKFFCLLSITILSIAIFSYKSININADTNNANIEIKAPVGLLIEYSTGEVIFEKNADEKMYPASMTKMIGLYLILESLEKGEIKFEDIVSVSANAASMGGAQVFLQPGEKISVEDLFKSVAIVSANDAIVALGELVSGSEESFVSDMNSKARELGMSNSNFVNPTGFHDPEHYTTARDMALLGAKLIDRFSDPLLKYTSLYESYIREDSEQPFWLVNTNKLTRFYEGVDGLKTGFTGESRYCLTATASKNGLRFISVIMKSESAKSRNADTSKLLDYGFNTYKSELLFNANKTITTFTFTNAKEENTQVGCLKDVRVTLNKKEDPKNIKVTIRINKYDSPIEAGEVVGYLEVFSPSGNSSKYELVSLEKVERLSFFNLIQRFYRELLF